MEDFGYCQSGSGRSDRFVPEFLGKSEGNEGFLVLLGKYSFEVARLECFK